MTRPFRMRLHASIWVFSFYLVTLELKSIHNFLKTRMLLEIFYAEFRYRLSSFEPLCLLNKTAAKTVKRSITTTLVRVPSEWRRSPAPPFLLFPVYSPLSGSGRGISVHLILGVSVGHLWCSWCHNGTGTRASLVLKTVQGLVCCRVRCVCVT